MKTLFFVLSVTLCASAQAEILDYTGAPLTDLTTLFGTIPDFSVPALASGQIVIDDTLAPDMNNQLATVSSFDFSATDSYMTTNKVFSGDGVGSFYFSTDAKGNITGWSLDIVSQEIGSSLRSELTLSMGGDTYTKYAVDHSCNFFECYAFTVANSKAGSWTTKATEAPEIDPASATTALTLLLGGVAVMRGRRT